MFQDDPDGAVAALRKAQDAERRMSRNDPAIYLWHADFVEALAAIGARRRGAGGARPRPARWPTGSDGSVVLLGLARAEALVTAADGDPRAGAAALAAAIRRRRGPPVPDGGRPGLARARRAGAARAPPRRGADRPAGGDLRVRRDRRGAVAVRRPAELARLDGGQGSGLSDTERQIVDLVLAGATNREIARATHLSVKAIEAKLTRLYRRHGVRNRAQLTRALENAPPGRAG